MELSGRLILAVASALLAGPPAAAQELWVDAARLAALPTAGAAWERLLRHASESTDAPDLSDKDDPSNVRVLAKALVYARTGEAHRRDEVVAACRAARGSEGESTLALGRELAAYVIAADLVRLPAEEDRLFRAWLGEVRHRRLRGRTLISTHEDRPNNWGTHAGASRIAVALYLGDRRDLSRAARVFRGYLGDRSAYAGFRYGDTGWQARPREPVGVNPLGALRGPHSIDGVLPDDQRRGGAFRWPPPRENYVYEALQGALAQAILLHNAGYDVWSWEDQALLRAFRWLHEEAHFPAVGDDTWQPHVVNHYYGSSFPAPLPSRPGKNVGFSDWTHGAPADAGRAAGGSPDTAPEAPPGGDGAPPRPASPPGPS